jgi:hypothetical protein
MRDGVGCVPQRQMWRLLQVALQQFVSVWARPDPIKGSGVSRGPRGHDPPPQWPNHNCTFLIFADNYLVAACIANYELAAILVV